jgi:hypothetical protein|nr:MAG TPA: Double zinc ribbon protein [Caudoviricetes sp.]
MAGKEYTTNCGTCGNPREERTPGCTQCNNRHAKWKVKGDIRYKAPAERKCVKCGIEVSKINPDCERCKLRQASQNLRAYREKNPDPNEFRSQELTKKYYDDWAVARRKRIAGRERLAAVGRRPNV